MAEANNSSDARAEEIAALKQQIEEMQKRLDELTRETRPDPQQPQDPYRQSPYQQIPYQPNPYQPNPYMPGAYQQSSLRAKDHVAAGLLRIFLGMFGIHKFYLGYNTPGFIMLGVTVLGGLVTFGLALSVVWLIGLIEGVIYLVKSQQDFERTYVAGKKEWF